MAGEIEPIPKLPKEIVEAVNDDKLAVFIGAGVSRLVGCLGWSQLAKRLVNQCFAGGLITYKDQESLLRMPDGRKLITICHRLLEGKKRESIFFEEMRNALLENVQVPIPNVYDDIYRLRGVFVTTNADRLFHRFFDKRSIHYRPDELRARDVERLNLYHIHGCIEAPDTMVFTLRQYFDRYGDTGSGKSNEFREFMRTLFHKYTILFLGYGLEEFEVLEYLFGSFGDSKTKVLRHFILTPLFTGQEGLLQLEQSYYSDMGIRVLAFQKDAHGYKQLETVIREWNGRLNRISAYLHSTFHEIDDLVESPTAESQRRLFQIIRNDMPLEDYAFKRLAELREASKWLSALRQERYFEGSKNPPAREVEKQPGFFTMPMWNVLPYLEKVADQNRNNPDSAITDMLVAIVDGITGYRDAKGQRIDNYRTGWFVVKILCKLPIEKWADGHINFIGEALNTRFGSGVVDSEIGKKVLPTLIEGKRVDLIQKLLNIIFGFKPGADASEKIVPVMKEYWLKEAVGGTNTEGIAGLCGLEALDIVLAKIREVASASEYIFNAWIPSIEPSAQTRFPDKYQSQLVTFAREMLERRSADEVRERVASLLNEKDFIFRRLGIHGVNYHYDKLQDLFWGWQGNPLTDIELHHELYLLLEQKCRRFADWQMDKLLAWVESLEYPDPTEPRKDVFDAWKRRGWLTALKDAEDPRVKELLDRYNKKAPGEVDHPSFLSWSESGFVRDLSPKSAADLSLMQNQEIATFLNEWKEEEHRGLGVVSSEGLSVALKRCVQDNPEKFASDMSPFWEVPEVYKHDILHGLKEAWASQKDFSVGQVLMFIERLTGSESLWQKEYAEHEENYRNWIVREVAEFLEAGTQSDKHAFDPEHLPKIEKILLDLTNRAESEVSARTRIIDSVLASPRACIFSAAVNYALRYARLYGKDKEIRLPSAIREVFNNRLDPATESAIDFWVTLGKYIPNLVFLDRQWVFAEVDRIFPRDSEKHWVASFAAYLSYSHNVYEEIYSELRNRSHYRKALETDFGDSYVTEKLVQHICIAFLEDWESVTDANSLMRRILELAKIEQLSEVIGFLGRLEGEEPRAKLKDRIKALWKALFELLQAKQREAQYQRVISELYLWLGIVDKIDDEIKDWSLLTAKYVGAQYHESGLVEQLAKHVDQSPKEVAEIYIEMLNAGTYPYYDKENILQIVRSLYRQGAKEQADIICNMHGEVGDYSLRPLYEEYNREVERKE